MVVSGCGLWSFLWILGNPISNPIGNPIGVGFVFQGLSGTLGICDPSRFQATMAARSLEVDVAALNLAIGTSSAASQLRRGVSSWCRNHRNNMKQPTSTNIWLV